MSSSSKSARVSASTLKVIDALADTIIPSEGPDRPGALDMSLSGNFLEFIGEFPGAVRVFVISCWMWEFSPIWIGRFARFSRLSFEDRTRVLESWEGSRFFFRRGALLILKSILMAAFYNDPAIWPHIGYKEGCLSEPPKKPETAEA